MPLNTSSTRHSFLYVFILILGVEAYGQETLQRLRETAENTTSIKCNFNQTKHYSFLQNDIITTGTFYYSKPSKMKWEQLNPNPYTLIMNNGLIHINDNGDKKQVNSSKHKLGMRMNALIFNMINGSILDDPNFEREIEETDNRLIIQLKGKVKGQSFENITLNFALETLNLISLKLSEGQGDYSLIEFYDHQINKGIDSDEFIIK